MRVSNVSNGMQLPKLSKAAHSPKLYKATRLPKVQVLHKCDFGDCQRGFTRRSDLLRHQKIHDENSKTFACGQCKFRTRQKANLDEHQHVHTGQKPYKCSEANCPRRYASRSTLTRHRQKVHDYVAKHTSAFYEARAPRSYMMKKSVTKQRGIRKVDSIPSSSSAASFASFGPWETASLNSPSTASESSLGSPAPQYVAHAAKVDPVADLANATDAMTLSLTQGTTTSHLASSTSFDPIICNGLADFDQFELDLTNETMVDRLLKELGASNSIKLPPAAQAAPALQTGDLYFDSPSALDYSGSGSWATSGYSGQQQQSPFVGGNAHGSYAGNGMNNVSMSVDFSDWYQQPQPQIQQYQPQQQQAHQLGQSASNDGYFFFQATPQESFASYQSPPAPDFGSFGELPPLDMNYNVPQAQKPSSQYAPFAANSEAELHHVMMQRYGPATFFPTH